jgi:hypothetical protein
VRVRKRENHTHRQLSYACAIIKSDRRSPLEGSHCYYHHSLRKGGKDEAAEVFMGSRGHPAGNSRLPVESAGWHLISKPKQAQPKADSA